MSFVEWQVVEIPGAHVQHGELPIANGERSVAIQPFDVESSLLGYTQSGPLVSTSPSDLFIRGTADGANNLRFDRAGSVGSQTISWSLLQIAGARVQHGSAAFADGGGLVTTPIAGVDPGHAVPFGGGFGGTGGRTSYVTDASPTAAWGTLDLSSEELRITRRGVIAPADLPWSVIDMR